MRSQKAIAEQSVIVSIPRDAPDQFDYSDGTRKYWLTTEYAVDLYNELKAALGI